MALASDLKMFPGAADVVRVGTKRWKPNHSAILKKLLDEVRSFLSDRTELSFEQLRHEFEKADERVPAGNQYAHILYGPEPLFLSNGELKTDIKGLLLQPRARISKKGNLVVDL